jgi:hypothetical protein
MKYTLGLRWYTIEMVLLRAYIRDWLLKFGKVPYNLFALVLLLIGFVLATFVLMTSPLYRKPPVMGAWFVGPTHRLMRGVNPFKRRT